MKAKQLLSEYLNRGVTGEELRTRLANDPSRDARTILEIVAMEESCRHALKDFSPPPDASQRLVEKVVAVESWIPAEDQLPETAPPQGWLSRLVPALDVVGHGVDKVEKKRKKRPAAKKARSRRKSAPRRKKKK